MFTTGRLLGLRYCCLQLSRKPPIQTTSHSTLHFLGVFSNTHTKREVHRMNGCRENRRTVRHTETPSIIVDMDLINILHEVAIFSSFLEADLYIWEYSGMIDRPYFLLMLILMAMLMQMLPILTPTQIPMLTPTLVLDITYSPSMASVRTLCPPWLAWPVM